MNKKYLLAIPVIFILTMFSGLTVFNYGFMEGHKSGYVGALKDVRNFANVDFEWTDNGDGTYSVDIWSNDQLISKGQAEAHIYVEHYRDGVLLSADHHAGTITNLGLDWIEVKLSSTQNATQIAKYISCSNDATSPSSAWIELIDEIAANGLTRAEGDYSDVGVGSWTVVEAFSVTGTQSVQLYGLQWDSFSMNGNSLLCADTSAQKNCVNGDTLTVTWTITVT